MYIYCEFLGLAEGKDNGVLPPHPEVLTGRWENIS
jgi:hypothetical protein